MEGAKRWPASDYEMMVSTMPEYVNDERFFVYYMTVSGHMNYNFRGNSMSAKNKDAVKDLPLSENGQAYIACHVELDKALEYMLQQLKDAGQLEKTLIVMSADHYPYAMTTEEYEELAGKSLAYGKDVFRNSLIMWNVAFEENPIVIDKPCCSVDLLPTILNLLGMEYDSRMYAGKDIFSDHEGLVIFNDRSFVSDGVIYNRKTKEAIWLKDEQGNYIVPEDQQEAYLKDKQQDVKDRYQFSAYILEENYYADVEAARISE
jgi:arylsulfatase A-like enzyme